MSDQNEITACSSSAGIISDSEMNRPKWEDLNMDCLVNIFGRLEMESLLLDIPFVCKSWYKATLNSLCWRHLVFPKISRDSMCYDNKFRARIYVEYQLKGNFNVTKFIKSVIKRSDRSATVLALPELCTGEALLYAADECPDLWALLLPEGLSSKRMFELPNLMSKWKSLEFVRLGSTFKMQEVLAQINIHCKNFVALAITRASIGEDEASAIVTLVPNIMVLDLRFACMEKENLVMILQGCKDLVQFDVRDCIGFDEGDDEILKLASHIITFKHEGSRLPNFNFDYVPDQLHLSFFDGFNDDDYDDFFDGIFHDGNISD